MYDHGVMTAGCFTESRMSIKRMITVTVSLHVTTKTTPISYRLDVWPQRDTTGLELLPQQFHGIGDLDTDSGVV